MSSPSPVPGRFSRLHLSCSDKASMKKPKVSRRRVSSPRKPSKRSIATLEVQELEAMREHLEGLAKAAPPRWNADPEDVRRSVVKLVLTLVEFIRQLLERQAIRRMDAGTLTPGETEAVGLALMRSEESRVGEE